MESLAYCVKCHARLSGRQRKFCGRACKNADTNHRHQGYLRQQARAMERKRMLVLEAGAKCSACGYHRNLAALTWHHCEPATKLFSLDLRSLSNRSETEIRREVAKCILLCANCHAETHWPQFSTP